MVNRQWLHNLWRYGFRNIGGKMTKQELNKLQAAAEVLDDNGREILAESLWYVFETEGGER